MRPETDNYGRKFVGRVWGSGDGNIPVRTFTLPDGSQVMVSRITFGGGVCPERRQFLELPDLGAEIRAMPDVVDAPITD